MMHDRADKEVQKTDGIQQSIDVMQLHCDVSILALPCEL